MNCQEVIQLMHRYLDQDLNQEEDQIMHLHIQGCPDCAAMFKRLQTLSNELELLPKVVPAFSLVDAILPHLDEVDRMNAVNSQSSTDAAPILHMPNRKQDQVQRKKWLSRGTASGVVAAGLILGLFIVNSNMTQDKVATEADMIQQDIASTGKFDQQAESAPSQSAENFMDIKKFAVYDVNSPTTNKVPASSNSVPTETVHSNEQVKSSENSPSGSANQATPQPPQKMEVGQTERNTAPSTEGTAKQPDETPVQPSPTEENTPMSPDVNSLEAEDQYGAREAPPISGLAMPPQEEARMEAPAAKKAGDPSMGLMFTPSSDLPSPNGTYMAVIDNRKVVVKHNDQVVFTSALELKEHDQIILVNWNGENELYYDVISGDVNQHYMIDMKGLKESSIKN